MTPVDQQEGDANASIYGFEYDDLNRLVNAKYNEESSPSDYNMNAIDNYSVSNITYDLNGNIETLNRRGFITTNSFGDIDQMTYTYNANQLQAVNDAITTNSKGFDDGNTSGNDYQYDDNGNMIRDNNKGISITYNYLNLPTLITFDGNENIAILYDAAGVKLTKTSTDASGNSSTKDYVGGIEYANGTLEAIYHSEGRLTPKTGGGYLFEYTIKDHLGNSRVSFADLNGDGQISTDANNSEILQTNHYYPFGMQHEPASTVTGVENAYQYNGKELNSNFGLDRLDYGARWYDASIARWSVVDPLSEKYYGWSNYNYVMNSPINAIDPDGNLVVIQVNSVGLF